MTDILYEVGNTGFEDSNKIVDTQIINHVNDLFKERDIVEIQEYLQDEINDKIIGLGNSLNTRLQDKDQINDLILSCCDKYEEIYNSDCKEIEDSLIQLCFDKNNTEDEQNKRSRIEFDILIDQTAISPLDSTQLQRVFQDLESKRFNYDLELKLKQFVEDSSLDSNDMKSSFNMELFNELYPDMLRFYAKDNYESKVVLNDGIQKIVDKYYTGIITKLQSLNIGNFIESYEQLTDSDVLVGDGINSSNTTSTTNRTSHHKDVFSVIDAFIDRLIMLDGELQKINKQNDHKDTENDYILFEDTVAHQLVKIYHYIETNKLEKMLTTGYTNIKRLIVQNSHFDTATSTSADTTTSNEKNKLTDLYIELVKEEITQLANIVSKDYSSVTLENTNLDLYASNKNTPIGSTTTNISTSNNTNMNININELYNQVDNYYCNGWYSSELVEIGRDLNYIKLLFHQLFEVFNIPLDSKGTNSHLSSSSSLQTLQQDLQLFKTDIYNNVLHISEYQKETIAIDSDDLVHSVTDDLIINESINTDVLIGKLTSNTNHLLWNNYLNQL